MKNAIDTAMVLAAGLGKRMRPLTDDRPKPLVPVLGKPLVDYALDRFAEEGVSNCIVNVHYHADMMESHLSARSRPVIAISDERDLLLETGGALLKARSQFNTKPIFSTNTDAILVDRSAGACRQLAEAWSDEDMDALLLLCPLTQASGYTGYGDFLLDAVGRLSWPSDASPEQAPRYVFTGLQILHPRILGDEPVRPMSTKVFWDKAMEAGRLFGLLYDGWWMHVGDPDGLEQAERRLRAHAQEKV